MPKEALNRPAHCVDVFLFVALFGPHAMTDLSRFVGEERKSSFGVVRSVNDPLLPWLIR